MDRVTSPSCPAATLTVDGVAASAMEGWLIASVTVCVATPFQLGESVRGALPATALVPTFNVRTADDYVAPSDAGAKFAVTPAGSPLTEREAGDAKLPARVMVCGTLPLPPTAMEAQGAGMLSVRLTAAKGEASLHYHRRRTPSRRRGVRRSLPHGEAPDDPPSDATCS